MDSAQQPLGDRYLLRHELGAGGAATVHLARDQKLDRDVAVKVLREEVSQAIGHQRFLREIRFASELRHAHIVPVLDFGETDGRLWYVMPYLSDGTLRQRLDRQSQLPVDTVEQWGEELAEALAHAHAHGIVHRDVKPENVMLDGDHALLSDFGIARSIDVSAMDSLTSAGIAIGTPAYMSPEQASGEAAVEGRSDVYSLACVLYECLAGVAPFVGPTPQSVIAQRFAHMPHPVASYRSTIPTRLQSAIERGLCVVPVDRPSASGFLALLRGEVTAERIDAARGGSTTRRTRTLRTLASLGLLGVAGVSAYSWSRNPVLDAGRVVVFPVDVRSDAGGANRESGVSSLVGVALDGVPELQWLEGDGLLGGKESDDPRKRHARRIEVTRGAGAAFFIEGSLVQGRDSATVVMRLVDVKADSIVSRTAASAATTTAAGATAAVPTLALRAVGLLLPRLLAPGRQVDLRALTDRKPEAIAAFLLGEREFRRSRFEEALGHYQQALVLDSNLAIAALKAARSARALFREDDTRRLVDLALVDPARLPGASAYVARGLAHFYRHDADSALLLLGHAASLAPRWPETYAAIGDVYFFEGINGVNTDSAANVSYLRAHQEDKDFTPVLQQLAWLAARRRDPAATRTLLADYRRTSTSDTSFIQAVSAASDCQEGRLASDAAWDSIAQSGGAALILAGKTLAGGGADLRCARAALGAVFRKPGPPSRDHFGALLGLNAIAVASSDTTALRTLADNAMSIALRIRNLLVLDAVAGLPLEPQVGTIEADMMAQLSTLSAEEHWLIGLRVSQQQKRDKLRAVIVSMQRRVRTSIDTLMLASLQSRMHLLTGDTATAIARLDRVNREATFQQIEWRFFEARSADDVLLAEIAMRRGEHERARGYAERIDQPYPLTNLLFLRASLELRIRASEALQDAPRARDLRDRLSRLVQSR